MYLLWTAHSSLEKDNTLNHSCVSPGMGCLVYTGRVPVEGKIISVCDLFEIYDNKLNYYHYQPGSNIIIAGSFK